MVFKDPADVLHERDAGDVAHEQGDADGSVGQIKKDIALEGAVLGPKQVGKQKGERQKEAEGEGKITAAEVRLLADGGAYKFTTSIVTSNAVINALGPYEIPNVRVDAYDVYTNNVPTAANRIALDTKVTGTIGRRMSSTPPTRPEMKSPLEARKR